MSCIGQDGNIAEQFFLPKHTRTAHRMQEQIHTFGAIRFAFTRTGIFHLKYCAVECTECAEHSGESYG